MADDILIILDKCLERIRRGETVEQCLADYPDYRLELEPLLETAQTLTAAPRVSSTAEFRQTSRARLMSRIRAESVQRNQGREKAFNLSSLRRSLVFRTLIPVTLVVLVALIVWIALPVFSPAPVSAAEFTLSILSGSAEIKTTGSSTWLSGNDGMHLKIGSQVRTTSKSSALLTFFDGSTTKLEPGAEVLVSRSEYIDQRFTFIILEQQSGKTWSYVQAGGEEKPYFAVQTPQGKALALGTAFSTEVHSSGYTRFAVKEGAIQIIEGNREIRLEADKQIQVGDKIALSTPLPVPPAENELIISTGLPGIGSVRDPSGASTGYCPDGLAFNQITNSKSVLYSAGQQILIEEPASGEYVLAVRSISNEAIPINIQAKRDGKVVFQYNETLQVPSQDGWVIRIKLDTANQATISGDIVSIKPLSGKGPENVVEPELAKKRAVPITPGSSQSGIPTSNLAATPTIENTTPIQPSLPSTVKPGVPASQGQISSPNPVKTPPSTTPVVTDSVATPTSTVSDTKPVVTVQPTPEPTKTPTTSSGGTTSVTAIPQPTKTASPTKTPTTSSGGTTSATAIPQPTKTPTTSSGGTTSATAIPQPTKTASPTKTPTTSNGTTNDTAGP